jgi:hypothetical protein
MTTRGRSAPSAAVERPSALPSRWKPRVALTCLPVVLCSSSGMLALTVRGRWPGRRPRWPGWETIARVSAARGIDVAAALSLDRLDRAAVERRALDRLGRADQRAAQHRRRPAPVGVEQHRGAAGDLGRGGGRAGHAGEARRPEARS